MKDTVAETVADNVVADLVPTLEAMGLRRYSIIAGIELALKRLRDSETAKDAGSSK